MRNLVVCCDGTWNSPENMDEGELAPTNVLKLFRAVDEQHPDIEQLTRYQSGVGTDGKLDSMFGGLLGIGIDEDIRDCYQWLSDKYQSGDRLYLFGFSRGAFCARSLAGFICKYGLIDFSDVSERSEQVKRLFEAYKKGSSAPSDISFHAKSDSTHFIGVWDTVGSLGIPDDKAILNLFDREDDLQFHNTKLSSKVKVARHAVALNEMRGSFTPTLWTKAAKHTDLKQTWFTGVHSDVGGGYRDCGLSDIALTWMIEEAAAHGLLFTLGTLDEERGQIHPDPFAQIHNSYTGVMKVLRTAPRSIPQLVACESQSSQEQVHPSVLERIASPPIDQASFFPSIRAQANGSYKIDIYAKHRWHWTGIYLEQGREYKFEASGEWMDSSIVCGPDGADDGKFHIAEIAHSIGSIADFFEKGFNKLTKTNRDIIGISRRCPDVPWFALVGAVANGENPGTDGTHDALEKFQIGSKKDSFTPSKSGYLYCFANDAWSAYGNNRGYVTLVVTPS